VKGSVVTADACPSDVAAFEQVAAKLGPADWAAVHRILSGLAEHLGSPEAARLWLATLAPEFGTTPLTALAEGKAQLVWAVLESRWGPNPALTAAVARRRVYRWHDLAGPVNCPAVPHRQQTVVDGCVGRVANLPSSAQQVGNLPHHLPSANGTLGGGDPEPAVIKRWLGRRGWVPSANGARGPAWPCRGQQTALAAGRRPVTRAAGP
jgi:hypothetical protein